MIVKSDKHDNPSFIGFGCTHTDNFEVISIPLAVFDAGLSSFSRLYDEHDCDLGEFYLPTEIQTNYTGGRALDLILTRRQND